MGVKRKCFAVEPRKIKLIIQPFQIHQKIPMLIPGDVTWHKAMQSFIRSAQMQLEVRPSV